MPESLSCGICPSNEGRLGPDYAPDGELISPDLLCRVSCTMDANFSSRKVWCKPVLKRKVSNGTWTTDFRVVEVSLEESQSGVDQITAVVSKTFRRIGTGKVNHKARFLEFVKMAERWKAVLVRLAIFFSYKKIFQKGNCNEVS